MVSVGDIVVKLAGRDAGEIGAIIDVIDEHCVLIEGNTRRRKCNIQHLEFLGKQIEIKKNATREDVIKALKEEGLKFKEVKKGKSRERKERQVKLRKTKVQETEPKKKDSKKK